MVRGVVEGETGLLGQQSRTSLRPKRHRTTRRTITCVYAMCPCMCRMVGRVNAEGLYYMILIHIDPYVALNAACEMSSLPFGVSRKGQDSKNLLDEDYVSGIIGIGSNRRNESEKKGVGWLCGIWTSYEPTTTTTTTTTTTATTMRKNDDYDDDDVVLPAICPTDQPSMFLRIKLPLTLHPYNEPPAIHYS
ncbi:hypothetical protein M0802_004130 [Mischocyttarus mexicanus]|nr:hypothetical protein M0802_004130 [Mischocyttarus mexicanus]